MIVEVTFLLYYAHDNSLSRRVLLVKRQYPSLSYTVRKKKLQHYSSLKENIQAFLFQKFSIVAMTFEKCIPLTQGA